MKKNGAPVKAYISLGSNSPDAAEKLESALGEISRLDGVRIAKCSSVFHTQPQDYSDQPWFQNQAAELDVLDEDLLPADLLASFLKIEKALGRNRGPGAVRYGPRSIDIDLLLFGRLESDAENCLLPHPRMKNRAFVLVPLQEIAPQLVVDGMGISFWLDRLDFRVEGKSIFQCQLGLHGLESGNIRKGICGN